MLRDEFNQLMKVFREAASASGKIPDLEAVFRQSAAFFEHLREQIAKGSPEEQKEAIRMMSELYAEMMAETKRISERTGLSEEQLASFAENPANFTPEQWNSLQASKDKILDAGSTLAKTVQNANKINEAAKPLKQEKKGPHKSDWMKS